MSRLHSFKNKKDPLLHINDCDISNNCDINTIVMTSDVDTDIGKGKANNIHRNNGLLRVLLFAHVNNYEVQ